MGFAEQARISEQHRAAIARLLALIGIDTARLFPLLDVNNLDKTFGTYFDQMKTVVNARRTISASLGSTYYNAIRSDSGLTDIFTPLLDSNVSEEQLFNSLLTTGPIAMKKSMASGAQPAAARSVALAATIRANQRHVANGSRGTILNAVHRDKRAVGWARLTDGRPCAFCALLASRGPAYKSEGTSRFRAHDGCGCTAVPVFDASAPWPGRAEEFRQNYDQHIAGKHPGGDGNNKAVRAWRKHYDSTELAGNKEVAKVVDASLTQIESSVGWKTAFDSAASRLPTNKAMIGRVGGRELTASETAQLTEATATKTRLDQIRRSWNTASDTERELMVKELAQISGRPADKFIQYSIPSFVRDQEAIIRELETLRVGKLDITDLKLPGKVMSEHLDAVLQAGNALGSELDRRIAARIASGVTADTTAEQAALAKVEAQLKKALAEREALKESLRAKAIARVDSATLPYAGTREEQIEKTLRSLLYLDKKSKALETTIRRLDKEQSRYISLLEKLKAGDASSGPIYNQILREETMKILQEIRSLGGNGATYVSGKTAKAITSGDLLEAMRKAEAAYPTAWLDLLRAKYPQMDLGKSARGYNRGNVIRLSQGASKLPGDIGYDAVSVHELGHAMEDVVAGLKELEWAYHTRRGAIKDLEGVLTGPGKTEHMGAGYRRDERTIADEWRERYTGKVYGGTASSSWEIFTTGIESLMSGSRYFQSEKLGFDTEFRDWMLGVLTLLG